MMKYTNFKTLALILSAFALLAFTGCESKPGTPSDSGFGSIGNIAPVAKAGADQTVTEGDAVTLDGSGSSDPDGTIVSYEWKEGSTDLSTDKSFTKSDFSVGTHTITLTVTDNNGTSASDSVTVTVNAVPANQAPIAKAGADQTVTEGDTVTLNGSASSDPDGTIASYRWTEGSTDLSTAISFTKSDFSIGTHTITLTVTDNDGASASDSMTVTVNAANILPVAAAGADQTVTEGDTVTLNGSGSNDPDGTITSYKWTEGTTDLSLAVSFTKSNFSVGTHTITLTVTDNDGASASDSVTVIVNSSTISGPIKISKTGQSVSYDETGVVVTNLKDDGYYQYGVDFNFTNNSDGIITDNNTKLIWDQNGSANELTMAEAEAYCTAKGTGWRVPNVHEYFSILDYSKNPALDATYFNVVAAEFWTSTKDAASSSQYWTISERLASLDSWTNGTKNIRCVKGDELTPPASGRFTKIAADGSSLDDSNVTWVAVKDNWTGLLWQKSDNGAPLTWHEAINYCEGLTLAGKEWYLPNIKQVHHLIDLTKEDPALDTNYFSVASSSNVFWTSTTDMFVNSGSNELAWAVYQYHGADVLAGILKTDSGSDHTALCVSSTTTPSEAEGVLDDTFGNNGIVVDGNAAGGIDDDDYGNDIVLDEAGNIYIAGYSYGPNNDYDMVIWKYDRNGTLDSSFGGDGIVVDHNAAGGDGDDYGYGIALDAAGNVYVTGYSRTVDTSSNMVIWKYNSSGSLDSSFGGDGIVIDHDAAGGDENDNGESIALDAAGNVYVTGWSNGLNGDADMVIWKYDSTGTLDSSFGGNGIVVDHNAAGGDSDDQGRDITLDTAGNVYVTGYSLGSDTSYDMAIWKYDSTGSLDSNFGGNGIVVDHNASGGNSSDFGRGITLDAVGNVYVTGTSRGVANGDMAIWKYDNTGSLDSSFGGNGIVVNHNAAGGNGLDIGEDITLDAVGNVYVTGWSNGLNSDEDMVIWRYDSIGSLDSSFGGDGIVIDHDAAGGDRYDYGYGIALDTAGNVYVTGRSRSSAANSDMVIWKYK